MKRVISIVQFKGGTGKSSLTENLSYAFALYGKKVLVIDADGKPNASTTLLKGQATPTLTNVLKGEALLSDAMKQARPGLWVIPGDTGLDSASNHLRDHFSSYYTLGKAIAALPEFDYVLIDHAGAYTPVMVACLLASTEMLIPCELESYAVQGLFDMFDKLQDTLSTHAIRNAGIIPYNFDLRYSMAPLYLKQLRKTFGDLITAVIRTDATVPRAQSVKQTVFEYDPHSKVAEDFRTLADDLIAEAEPTP